MVAICIAPLSSTSCTNLSSSTDSPPTEYHNSLGLRCPNSRTSCRISKLLHVSGSQNHDTFSQPSYRSFPSLTKCPQWWTTTSKRSSDIQPETKMPTKGYTYYRPYHRQTDKLIWGTTNNINYTAQSKWGTTDPRTKWKMKLLKPQSHNTPTLPSMKTKQTKNRSPKNPKPQSTKITNKIPNPTSNLQCR